MPLQRRLGLVDATVIGVGSMLGAGVFAVFAPAVDVAGAGVVVAILLAGVVALANATSTAQLAAQYPTSGGAYFYGRERLGPTWGFVAGWGFVVGKTASCAAMALTFGYYVVPDTPRVGAAFAVVLIVAVNLRGISRTAQVTRVLVAVTATVLLAVVAFGAGAPAAPGSAVAELWAGVADAGVLGVLQGAGLMFFAFAGYARVATLGEEVRDPRRTIPRAVVTALVLVVVLYLVIAVVALRALGVEALAASAAPLADVVAAAGGPVWLVVVGASTGCLGALLGLVAGVGRTGLAMAREGDLPRWFAAVDPRFGVPHRTETALGAVLVVLVLTLDLREVVSVSSFLVLTYYAVANSAALTQQAEHRRYPRWLAVLGLVGCVGLALTLPGTAVVAGFAVLALGLGGRALARRRPTTV
ncbi:amino acid/polyamine/organocation transporter, APC superfamily [Paraoerskovia marina]|uniref:Amino acid/polyamine/organocation transporter, APC superfamily n=1 Tax=Paraoerskovia marina TaxID=545619 RepID=A0A1H1TCU6_9CELL|nr:APC family permease [Paraoerskovia marina]SDS58050.1 amino acid/polyamine/organocation transporter, APC superfamily [Paraoerskovia marina]